MGIDLWVEKERNFLYFERIGSARHFDAMRRTIHTYLEEGEYGSRFPFILKSPDDEARFPIEEAKALKQEILTVRKEMKGRNFRAILTKDSNDKIIDYAIPKFALFPQDISSDERALKFVRDELVWCRAPKWTCDFVGVMENSIKVILNGKGRPDTTKVFDNEERLLEIILVFSRKQFVGIDSELFYWDMGIFPVLLQKPNPIYDAQKFETGDIAYENTTIDERLKIILKGCKLAIENNGNLGWSY